MKYRLLDILVCPSCQRNLTLTVFEENQIHIRLDRSDKRCSSCFFSDSVKATRTCEECYQSNITSGVLTCSCGSIFPIVDSIPVMLPHTRDYFKILRQEYPHNQAVPAQDYGYNTQGHSDAYKKTQQRFGFEWTRYPDWFEAEEKAIFLEETQIEPHLFYNKLILDAGCGMGRFTRIAGKLGGEVIGIDLSESVVKAHQTTAHLPYTHIVQADILHPPFRDNTFDIIYSLGVLHHTPDTHNAFSSLTKKLRQGGIISIWVYGTAGNYNNFKTNPLKPNRAQYVNNTCLFRTYWFLVALREIFSNMLRIITVKCPHRVLYVLCYILAFVGKIPLLKYLTFSAHPDWRVRLLENFDWLSPPFQHHHTKEEVKSWFQDEKIAITHMLHHGFIPKVGLRGTKKAQRDNNASGNAQENSFFSYNHS
jgi:SAM-dependent methyltransferase/uncharacterized protein YbaR (Trm112 family)